MFTGFDSSTRGLDSSTALEFVRALRIATDLVRNATIVSIYQAGESLYEVFDKVCLLYEGRMVYFGPVDLARQYFIDMGYIPATRQTTPDFLVSVTNALGRTMASKEHDEIRSPERRGKPIPQTALEFEEYYEHSEIKKINQADIASYKASFVGKEEIASAYKASAKAEQARHTRRQVSFSCCTYVFNVYDLSSEPLHDFHANASAECDASPNSNYEGQLHCSSPFNHVSQIFFFVARNLMISFNSSSVFVLQAIILGTTFVNIPDTTAAYFSRGGVLFLYENSLRRCDQKFTFYF